MLILFGVVVILYLLIGLKAITLKGHDGNSAWGIIIFISTLFGVLAAFAALSVRMPDTASNLCMIAGIAVGIVFVTKYFLANRNKLHWAHILHVVYVWVGVSLLSTLIFELIPYGGSNFTKSAWGFYTGLAAAGLMITYLIISTNSAKNKNI